ncbi:NAD(P)/FAD-dependent oxidoreductase [Nocardioides sp. JQ2195]|uniref:FAD-dependent oxidoreductase n=1 Tax=Nocardioides sp. JQ2195 TaxID=2592334 RepID=UPI001F1123F2|nr:NAD(P)/FAD-dependent oxidoreductase [Nocardioides sp. JQ2195]
MAEQSLAQSRPQSRPQPRPLADAPDGTHGEKRDVAIIGAGLAGCLAAALLGRRGHAVTLYERRADPRAAGAERGRSINLALSARGFGALAEVGLEQEVLAQGLPMHGRMVHAPDGPPQLQPYSADQDRAIHSVSRSRLNAILLDTAEAVPGVDIVFGHQLDSVDLDRGRLTFRTDDGPVEKVAGLVLGADGSYAASRRAVTFRPGFDFSQDYLSHGYKELTIPAVGGDFAIDPGALHIWPQGSSMMIALPNLDKSFTCTLFWTAEEFAALRTDDEIRDHFARHYPDVAGLIPDLVTDFRANPVGSLVTIRCSPWVHHGEGASLALLGDAAHAIVPFFGQGANCAFEDCIELDRQLAGSGDPVAALEAYQEARKANCDAIAEMALDNFVEMRDRVSSPVFRVRSKALHALERTFPGRFPTRYELVSFSTVPYVEIDERMRRQHLGLFGAAAGAGAMVLALVRRFRDARSSLLNHRDSRGSRVEA